MNEIFVDTLHFAAVLNPKDQWHELALAIETEIGNARLVTTETVLHEFLNFFAEFPPRIKRRAADFVNDLYETRAVDIVPHTQKIFFDGLRFYESLLDKGYSLTDCISMNTMRSRAITKVLSHDNHFTQEGFTVLL